MYNREKDSLMYELIDEWLKQYRETKDTELKTKTRALIVARMLPIIKRIAHNIARRAYDPVDDLIQAGSIGLLKAIDSFSVERNSSFKFYAGSLIIGEMRHYIRDKMNTIKVPRHIQELSYRINSFIGTLTVDQLNDLTSEYVAKALNVKTKDVDFAILTDRRKAILSLDNICESDHKNLNFEEMIPVQDYKEASNIADAKLILELVIARLPKEYRKLIEMYYYQDLNQTEISEKAGLTKMQTSRKLKKAFELLHDMIADSQLGNSLVGVF